jgi:hypothetical protein
MRQKNAERRENIIAFSWIIYLAFITFVCQLLIFNFNWGEIGLSLLIGTCSAMVGAFAALLASPYGADDSKRLANVSTTIATLVTGYVLAKIIDPLVVEMMKNASAFYEPKNSANALIGITSFLSGFLGTYQFRVYLSGKLTKIDSTLEKEIKIIDKEGQIIPTKTIVNETLKNPDLEQ